MRKFPLTAHEIAALVGGSVEGDGAKVIEALSSMESAGPAHLTYATDERRAAALLKCGAGVAIVARQPAQAPMTLIRVPDVDAVLTMAPPPCPIITGITWRQVRNTLLRL